VPPYFPELSDVLNDVRACRRCADVLTHAPRPIVQIHPQARLLIASQAPGRRAHASGVPFLDPSGERLRAWLGIGPEAFYDPTKVAILPTGFCYPGTGASGDLPPRPECRAHWHTQLLPHLARTALTLLIGQYAQAAHLGSRAKANLTQTVAAWRDYAPDILPMPHPSPRNRIWLRQNPWFEHEVIPYLQARVRTLLDEE